MPTVYQIVRVVQFLIFLCCGLALRYVYKQKLTSRTRLLFVAGAAAAVDIFAYIEVLASESASSCGSYVRMQCLATMIFSTAVLFLITQMAQLKLPAWIGRAIWSLVVVFLLLVMVDDEIGIIFRSFALADRKLAVRLMCYPGVVGIIFFSYNCCLTIGSLVIGMAGNFKNKTDDVTKYVAVWSVVPLCLYVLYYCDLTGGWDPKPTLELLFVYIVIQENKKYHVLDDGEIAREQILEEVGEGYIILDANRKLRDYNAIAAMLCPELKQPGEREVMIELIFLHNHGMLEHNGKICSVVVSDLKEYGDLVGYVVWLYDSTDEFYCMKELQDLKDQVRLTKRTNELFLQHMTDGLGSPIQIVEGRSHAILQDENTPDDIGEMTYEIMEAGQKLEDMVGVMKDYTSDARDKDSLHKLNYRASELIKGLKQLLLDRRKAYCREVSLHVGKGFPSEWNGDHEAIELLVEQLLRYAGINARIWGIDLGLSHEIRYSDALINMTFILEDHGITTSEWNRLNLMLVKGNKQIEHELSYIPFSLCKQLLQLLDATVDCSIEMEQSKIVIHFPQKIMNNDEFVREDTVFIEEQEKISDAEPEETEPLKRKLTVMVVDDNIIYLREMDSWLRKLNLKTVLAKSGEDALRIMGKRDIDMIFMDQMMPGMDGTCTLEKIRDWEKQQGRMPMPVVLLTADNTVGARRRYLSFGFNDYLSKPIQPQQICDLVRVYLNV